MKKIPIAIVAITLNEAHNMNSFLDCIQDWAQEVFIVDSYSVDDTVDIALSRGVRVVQRKFRGFGDQWNFALNCLPLSAPWTMKLDPDERLTPQVKKSISDIILKVDAQGLIINRRLWFLGSPLPVRQKLLRVWRTGSCKFTDVLVNEHPVVKGRIVDVAGEIEHHDSPSIEHWIQKQNRYSSAEARAFYEDRPMAAYPLLFGTSLERKMWLKKNFFKFPFRYAAVFLYCWLFLGAVKSGRAGLIWARLRADVYRYREYKFRELKARNGKVERVAFGTGVPDRRVPQYD